MHVFGIGGVMIFQGFKFGIIKQLKERCTFRIGDLHYVGHNTNLMVQLSHTWSWCVSILLMHSPKYHLEGTS
jgi:hypothetical protein